MGGAQSVHVLCELWWVFLVVFSPGLGSFFPLMSWSDLTEDSKGTLQISWTHSLSLQLFSFGNLPVNSWPPQSPSSVSSHQGLYQTPPGFPLSELWPRNSPGVRWGNHKDHFLCFLCSRLLSYAAWCPVSENHCFTYFVHFLKSCFMGEGKCSCPVTLSWLETAT